MAKWTAQQATTKLAARLSALRIIFSVRLTVSITIILTLVSRARGCATATPTVQTGKMKFPAPRAPSAQPVRSATTVASQNPTDTLACVTLASDSLRIAISREFSRLNSFSGDVSV